MEELNGFVIEYEGEGNDQEKLKIAVEGYGDETELLYRAVTLMTDSLNPEDSFDNDIEDYNATMTNLLLYILEGIAQVNGKLGDDQELSDEESLIYFTDLVNNNNNL